MSEETDATSPAPDPPPAVVPDGLEELLAWLRTRTPSIQQAKFAEQCIRRIQEEIRDPALRTAWEHRVTGATMRDLEAATGVNRARITWALGKHPAADV